MNHPDVRVADDAAVGFNNSNGMPVSVVFEARTADNEVREEMAVAKSGGSQMHPGGHFQDWKGN